MRRRAISRWVLITGALYLVSLALWFDFFFWMAVVAAAFIAGLLAFAAVVGLVMHVLAPGIWSPEERAKD